jgi:hypothetical protein
VNISQKNFEDMSELQKFETAHAWFKTREYVVKWVGGNRANTGFGQWQAFNTFLALSSLADKHQNLGWENSNLMEGLPPFYQAWIHDNIAWWSSDNAASMQSTPAKRS